MRKIQLTGGYLAKIKVNSDGVYDVEDERAKQLVEAGDATYLDEVEEEKEEEVKEVKKSKKKVMKPRKKRGYKTK